MRDLHLVIYEGYFGPKAASLRVYPRIVCSGETPQDGPRADHSQVKKHGFSLWNYSYHFRIPEPHERPTSINIEFHNARVIGDDQVIAGADFDAAMIQNIVVNHPGVVHDYEYKIAPTQELDYFNEDGGKIERYNYRMKYRILVTPGGVPPSPEHMAQLTAWSSRFDPTAEKQNADDSDPDEEGVGDKIGAITGELERTPVFRALRLLLFAIIAVAAAVISTMTLVQEFQAQTDFRWHTVNPEEDNRCVPFFDNAKEVAKDTNSVVLFHYNLENASVIFCSNASQSVFDDKMGADKFFDQMKDVTGGSCTLPNASSAVCSPVPTCVAPQLATTPTPYGVMWEYKIVPKSTNSTTFTTPCGVTFSKLSMDYASCSSPHVWPYRYSRGQYVYVLFLFTFFFAWIRLFLELAGVMMYHGNCCTSCGKIGVESYLFRMSFRGLFGPLYYVLLMIIRRTTLLPHVDDPPIPLDLFLILTDSLPNIVLPIFAVSGCSFNNVRLIVLLFLGILKTVIVVIINLVRIVGNCCKKDAVVDENIVAVESAAYAN